MLKSKIVFAFLKGCASVLERVLPVRIYGPLYVRCREFYDVRILGLAPMRPRTRYDVPAQEAEEISIVATQEAQADSKQKSKTGAWEPHLFLNSKSLASPQKPFVQCGGDLLDVPFDRSLPVGEPLRSVRVKCGMVICCAFKGRHRVLEQVILESFQARRGESVRWMLAGSTEEDCQFIEAMAIRTGRVAGFVCENSPLGRKWQSCVHSAYLYYDADLYAITGSDDVLSGKLVDHILEQHEINMQLSEDFLPDLYCANEWLVCSSMGKYSPMILKCGYEYESIFQPLGAGRFYSRKFMDAVEGYVFDSTLKRCLDDCGYSKINERGGLIEYYTIEDGPIVSVKGQWEQLNSLDVFFTSPTLNIREYAFEGYSALKDALHPNTFGFLFKATNFGFQFFD